MSEDEAFWRYTQQRFRDCRIFACPLCGVIDRHYFKAGRRQWQCKGCLDYFSATSRTAFDRHHLPFKKLLFAIVLYATNTTGTTASQLAAAIDVQYRTAFALLGKIREALVQTSDTQALAGLVHIDGMHACGKPRRPWRRSKADSVTVNNRLRNRKAAIDPTTRSYSDARNVEKRKNRRVVIVMRQCHPERGRGAVRTRVAVVLKESEATIRPIVTASVAGNSLVMTDSGSEYAWICTARQYEHKTVNHSREYATPDGVNNNQAESGISRLRRAEFGAYRGMRKTYLLDYATEMAWREDVRLLSIGERTKELVRRISACGLSPSWRGYWKGVQRKQELLFWRGSWANSQFLSDQIPTGA